MPTSNRANRARTRSRLRSRPGLRSGTSNSKSRTAKLNSNIKSKFNKNYKVKSNNRNRRSMTRKLKNAIGNAASALSNKARNAASFAHKHPMSTAVGVGSTVAGVSKMHSAMHPAMHHAPVKMGPGGIRSSEWAAINHNNGTSVPRNINTVYKTGYTNNGTRGRLAHSMRKVGNLKKKAANNKAKRNHANTRKATAAKIGNRTKKGGTSSCQPINNI